MSRKLCSCAFVVACTIIAGCAAPGSIKDASTLQLEAFASAQESVDSYIDLVDKEIEAVQALRATSLDLDAVVSAVEEVAEDNTVTADPVNALDTLSNSIAIKRQANAARPNNLEAIGTQHRQNMTHLKNLLKLLQQNQELVNLYLTTDIGPSPEQIEALGDELKALKQAEAGGGS